MIPTRFPVCPRPARMESLSSWLLRIANFYCVDIDTLFYAGFGLDRPSCWWEVDVKPSRSLLEAISMATGSSVASLESMTLACLTPHVIDHLEPQSRPYYQSYLKCFSLFEDLSAKHENEDDIQCKLPWIPDVPWRGFRLFERFCPVCVQDPKMPRLITWRTVLTTTCPRHGCLLFEKRGLSWNDRTQKGEEHQASPLTLWLDGLTHKAITRGHTQLGNDKIPVAVWTRFLRSLYAELIGRATSVEDVWRTSGISRPRSGPFEQMRLQDREKVSQCAAYLLQKWPIRLSKSLSGVPWRRRSHTPFFVACHLFKSPTWYEMLSLNKDFALQAIEAECGPEYGPSASAACNVMLAFVKPPQNAERPIHGATCADVLEVSAPIELRCVKQPPFFDLVTVSNACSSEL